jgi:hypothetical protein
MSNIFRETKRVVEQFFETEWWYRWRSWYYYYFDDEKNKYVKGSKQKARDYLTSTWDGIGDILMMMRLKIEHQYHELKHYGNQAYFYLDNHNIIKYGTNLDKLICFEIALRDYDKVETDSLNVIKHYYNKEKGNFANCFLIGDSEWLCHEYKNNQPAGWIIAVRNGGSLITSNDLEIYDIVYSLDLDNKRDRKIVEGVLENLYTTNLTIKDYHRLSKPLQKKVRGLRRNLTELLHARHLIKKIYNLDDTDDKYYNMWVNEEDDELRSKKLIEAENLYNEDKKKLWRELADYIAENGDGWWD